MDWSPEGDVHLLLGDNGVGKTSILEAVYILAQLAPPQGLRWRELIPQARDTGFVAGCLSGAAIQDDVRVGFDRQERRFRVGGKAPLSAAHHAQKHPVVFFRPGDLSLVQGGPRGRRRLLDGIATALVPEHRELMGRYNQALAARNALLRPQARGGELLDLWSQEAARYGAQIIAHRARASASSGPLNYSRKTIEPPSEPSIRAIWIGPSATASAKCGGASTTRREKVTWSAPAKCGNAPGPSPRTTTSPGTPANRRRRSAARRQKRRSRLARRSRSLRRPRRGWAPASPSAAPTIRSGGVSSSSRRPGLGCW